MNQQVSLGKRVHKLVLGATVVGAALVSQTAYAAVVTVDFTGNPFSTIPFNLDGVYLNVVSGATGTSGLATAGWDVNPYYTGSTTATPGFALFTPTGGGYVGGLGAATPLAPGALVGPASSFITGAMSANATGTNYFGFRFLNEGTGVTNYGYLVISQAAIPPIGGGVRLLGYAYENTGAAISVVPEPSAWLMMLGGLAAVGATLRKRMQDR